MALSGSSIGWRLRNVQRNTIEGLWRRACAPPGSAERKGLPDRCDRTWFVQTFCGGEDDPSSRGEDPIWHLVTSFMQYDSVALCAAVPALRRAYFTPHAVAAADGTVHHVIGFSADNPNVSDSAGLVRFLRKGFTGGIVHSKQSKSHVIVCLQLRQDNLTDCRMLCLMLRALWDRDVIECMGIILTVDTSTAAAAAEHGDSEDGQHTDEQARDDDERPRNKTRDKIFSEDDADSLSKQVDYLRHTLLAVGMGHIHVQPALGIHLQSLGALASHMRC
jgi:hypothetical protein